MPGKACIFQVASLCTAFLLTQVVTFAWQHPGIIYTAPYRILEAHHPDLMLPQAYLPLSLTCVEWEP
jgi:hypothetical protein